MELENLDNWYRKPDYRNDWNWLMKVVVMCTLKSGDTPMESNWDTSTQFKLQMADKKKVYEAVINFITWYNETKR